MNGVGKKHIPDWKSFIDWWFTIICFESHLLETVSKHDKVVTMNRDFNFKCYMLYKTIIGPWYDKSMMPLKNLRHHSTIVSHLCLTLIQTRKKNAEYASTQENFIIFVENRVFASSGNFWRTLKMMMFRKEMQKTN